MIVVPLQAIPNQSLTIQLDSIAFDIRIHSCNNVMAFDISINNVMVVQGQRAVPGYPLIPYPYLADGNFVFLTNNGDYPDYTQFSVTQYLVFASAAELSVINAST